MESASRPADSSDDRDRDCLKGLKEIGDGVDAPAPCTPSGFGMSQYSSSEEAPSSL